MPNFSKLKSDLKEHIEQQSAIAYRVTVTGPCNTELTFDINNLHMISGYPYISGIDLTTKKRRYFFGTFRVEQI